MLNAEPAPENEAVQRTTPDVPPARANLVKAWCARVLAAKEHHKDAFDQMCKNMRAARLGADGAWVKDGKYTANIIQRHINQSVAALYAKNPRATAKRRPRLEYAVWDGSQAALMQAMQIMETTVLQPEAAVMNPGAVVQAQMLLADIQDGQARTKMFNRVGKTMEHLFHYFLDEQEPKFKTSAKQLVRRTKVCGVGYVKLNFQRAYQTMPEITEQISDVSQQIEAAERILADIADQQLPDDSPDIEELKAILRDLQAKETQLVREGPVFTFPRSTQIIPDTRCKNLKGFVGARFVAEEFLLTHDEVKEQYKVDLGANYVNYDSKKLSAFEAAAGGYDKKTAKACAVYQVWDKQTRQVFTVADGYPDFLKEPAAPDTKLERFWPWFTLSFNDVEDEDSIWPLSDVQLMMPMQEEYNRSRQGLREHRRANRPKYISVKGRLDDQDKANLQSHPDSAVIELTALQPGEKAENLLQAFKHSPIDPAVYDTNVVFDDVLRVVGTQEANLGGVAKATATESAIAESSRVSAEASNVDDLDDMLTDLARATGQLMLAEISKETAVEIAGPGAAWPELSGEEIAKEIYLEIRAGSSGRPNKAAEIANFERMAPTLLQTPSISPEWFARKQLEILDDPIDLDEAILSGLPSIVAMNTAHKQAQVATGDPMTDPGMQGAAGAQNGPRGRDEQSGPGPQPGFPAAV